MSSAYQARINELIKKRGFSRKRAEANQRSAIKQGGDLNKDGAVTDKEWANFTGKNNDPGGSAKNKKDAKVDMKSFESLLGKLEASKKRQVRQKLVEGRRDIYAKGLAGMMSNF